MRLSRSTPFLGQTEAPAATAAEDWARRVAGVRIDAGHGRIWRRKSQNPPGDQATPILWWPARPPAPIAPRNRRSRQSSKGRLGGRRCAPRLRALPTVANLVARPPAPLARMTDRGAQKHSRPLGLRAISTGPGACVPPPPGPGRIRRCGATGQPRLTPREIAWGLSGLCCALNVRPQPGYGRSAAILRACDPPWPDRGRGQGRAFQPAG